MVHEVDSSGLAELRSPRNDLVRERAGDGLDHLVGDHGPFAIWERRLRVQPSATETTHAEGHFRVEEEIHYRAAVGPWRPLFALPLRWAVRRRQVPWWAPPDRLDERACRILALLACVQVVDGYLGTVITQTIAFASDEFGRSDTAQGVTLAAVRLGVVVALAVVFLADRRGRRGLLITTAVAAVVMTAIGSLSPGLWFLGGSQLVARGLTTGLGILIGVFAAEELPRGSRAYGISVLALAAALGAGMAVWVLPVADLDPAAWRIVYLVPLLAIPGLVTAGRRLPESRRFIANVRPGQSYKLNDDRRQIERKRLMLLAAAAFLLLVFAAPASQFQNDFLKDDRGFSAAGISLFTVLTTTPAGIGVFIAGRLADTRGRRVVGAIGLLAGTAFVVFGYHTSGPAMWTTTMLGGLLGSLTVALGVYGPELFSTANRARANGLIVALGVAGSATGLLLVGALSDRFGDYGPAFLVVAIGPLLAAVLVLRWFPETARVELETLNPGDIEAPSCGPEGADPA